MQSRLKSVAWATVGAGTGLAMMAIVWLAALTESRSQLQGPLPVVPAPAAMVGASELKILPSPPRQVIIPADADTVCADGTCVPAATIRAWLKAAPRSPTASGRK